MSERDYFINRVKSNPFGTDMLFSLFVSACLSYRRDTVVRPFPRAYIEHNDDDVDTKNYDELVSN